MPGLRVSFLGGVLAHGRNDNAILQFNVANPQWREEFHVTWPSDEYEPRDICAWLFDAPANDVVSGRIAGRAAIPTRHQVIALYDTILRDLRPAMDAIADNDIARRLNSSNHAIMVIGKLQGVLDFERGAEPAKHLIGSYNVTRTLIMKACVHSERQQFEEIAEMFKKLRVAWSHVERTVAPAQPSERLRVSSEQRNIPQSIAGGSEKTGTSRGDWSA
jgi:flagellar biosynthetic protein FliS